MYGCAIRIVVCCAWLDARPCFSIIGQFLRAERARTRYIFIFSYTRLRYSTMCFLSRRNWRIKSAGESLNLRQLASRAVIRKERGAIVVGNKDARGLYLLEDLIGTPSRIQLNKSTRQIVPPLDHWKKELAYLRRGRSQRTHEPES